VSRSLALEKANFLFANAVPPGSPGISSAAEFGRRLQVLAPARITENHDLIATAHRFLVHLQKFAMQKWTATTEVEKSRYPVPAAKLVEQRSACVSVMLARRDLS
jgi:hypothetical protein